ncbi:MAG: methyl-accepting chemotaxis protein [Gammaproteobacteria bacterium]|nr:methyl-accepting chemotaxis protein [Gammaproteobacteria bacterium]
MFSLKAKIILNSAILALLIVITAGYALHSMNRIGQELTAIAEQDIPLTQAISEIALMQLHQGIHFERALRQAASDGAGGNPRFQQEIDAFDRYDQRIGEQIARAEAITRSVLANTSQEMTAEEFTRVGQQVGEIASQHAEYSEHAQRAFDMLARGDTEQLTTLADAIAREEDALDDNIEALLHEIQGFTAMAAKRAEEQELNAVGTLSGLTLFGLIIGIAASTFIIISTLRPLKKVIGAMDDIAQGEGDLTRRLEVVDNHELGAICAAFNRFAGQVHGIITEVSNSSNQLAASAEELSCVTHELSQNTETAKTEIEQVATAMNEMSATVSEVAGNTSHVVDAANNADSEAVTGNQVVREVIQVIEAMADTVRQSSAVIRNLDEQSESISMVLDVIKSISEQTNLLALNAAIEAARAGEHGRGFAVVAEEVRSLAAKTQDSAGQIEDMIARLQEGAKEAVTSMDTSHEHAQRSVEKANEAGSSLDRITQSVSTINDMNTQIATAAEEQSAVAEEINRNITNIHDTANQSATAGQQTAIASQELASLAENLRGIVSRFKL